MDDIRSWWEVPCIAHFCHIFQKPLKLPEFEIEELEDALLLDYNPSPSSLLVQLFCNLLNGIVDRNIIEENWTFFLKLHLEWRCEYLGEKWNPMQGDKEYKDLPIRERVEILHRLCHWRMELDDIADLLRGVDGSTLRVEALGRDTEGFTYWYFYGTRLYKEAPKTKPRRKKKDEITLTPTPGKKGRGKGGGKTPGTPTPGRRRKGNKQEEEEEEEGVGTPGRKGRGQRSKGSESTPGTGRRTRGQRGKEEEEGETDKQVTNEEKDEESPLPDVNDASSTAANSEETATNNGDADTPASSTANVVVNGTPPPDTGWSIVCSTQEEWEGLIDSLQGSRQLEPRRLHHTLADLLPSIEGLLEMREKQFRLKMLAEMPRRTSDRIALKAAQKLEQERLEALERESQREEMRRELAEEVRKRDQEAEEKRQRKLEEAMRKRKVREEEQERVRKEEEENWSKALSGELSGPRAAALGAAESVSANVEGGVPEFLTFEEDKDEDMYTAMFKILNGLRRSEDGWVFEDPVTEAIAPGYFDVIEKPMDFCTVEKKLEGSQYKAKQEFVDDMELIFDNCCEYNGEGSEYYEVAEEMRKSFKQLMKLHFTGEQEPVVRRKRRESRSPSACKTPELTSESSSDESDSGSDQSFEVGRPSKPKGKVLKLPPDLEKKFAPQMMQQVGPPSRPMFPPPHAQQPPPPAYYQYMRQMQHAQLGQQMPPDMMYRHPYPPPRMPPPYPGHHFPPMQEGPPNMYPGYPPPGPPYLPPYRVPPYPPHPMHSHMMHYPRAVPPGMVHHQRHRGVQQSPSPSLAPRHSHSPSTASGSPVAVKPQLPAAMSPVQPSSRVSGGGRDSDGEAALREEEGGKLPSPSTPGAQPAAVQGEKGREGEPRPAQEEEREGEIAPTNEEGEEGQPTPKGEREGDGQPVQRAKAEGPQTHSRGERAERQPPLPGYGHPSLAYDAGRQAAYRYHMAAMQQHHQSPHDAYPHPPHPSHPHGYPHPPHPSHPHGYPHPPHPHSYSHPTHPHGYDHPPGYQPQSREEAYYAWQQHQQAMYGGRGEVPGGYPPEVMQQMYWQEMERRRRHHYAMLQQQEKRRREQGVPPSGRKPSSTMEDVPDYQDSLRKYALGLVENREENREHSKVEKDEEEGRSGLKDEEDGRSRVKDEADGRSGLKDEEDGRSRVKDEADGRSRVKDEEEGRSGVENEEGGRCSGVEKEEKEQQRTGEDKDRRKEDEKEGGTGVSDEQKEAGKDSLLPEKAHPSSRLQPKHSHPHPHRPPEHYPPHMMHSSLQNGFPSEADMARMHSHYPPPPPHMYPPPPYGPRHFDPQHRNGVPPSPSHHPAYASYYAHHQRMSYYPPHPYMQEHGAMSPEHMDQWRAEEMKRQQLAAMHGYRSPYPHPAMQQQHPQAPSPQPHSQKHTLQSPPEDGTEPATKKQRTSES